MDAIRIGTAGWSIPRTATHLYPDEGSHLERYARTFNGVEINSSFYRAHARATYVKWAAATPPRFKFAVKLIRAITHEQLLRQSRVPLQRFLEETSGLGDKRGPILIQLPPSLEFEARVAHRFFEGLRNRYAGLVVCEPRNPTWFGAAADRLLVQYQVARAAADPIRAAGAGEPGGWRGFAYFRLHGSPRMYWSPYSDDYLRTLATTLKTLAASVETWCIFDNTASGAAIQNAWQLKLAGPP